MKNIFMCSRGKDSVASLILAKELNIRVDEVVTFDTGAEYSCFETVGYKIKKMFPYAKHTLLKADFGLRDLLNFGCPWCASNGRWYTHKKIEVCDNYVPRYGVVEFIGFAADEMHRFRQLKPHKVRSLSIEQGLTGKDNLNLCRKYGFQWLVDGRDLYNYFDRVSCSCCDFQNYKTLYYKWKYFPTLWNELIEMQKAIRQPFKNGYTIFDFQRMFEQGYVPEGANL